MSSVSSSREGFRTRDSAAFLPSVGRPLPALVLTSTAGDEVRTKGYKQRQPFLLLVLPALDRPDCERWLAELARVRVEVDEVSAAILVVAPGTVEAARTWQAAHDFPYTLLADPNRSASQRFLSTREGASAGVALYAVDRYNYVLATWVGANAEALPTPAAALVPIRDAEQEDCGCGLPAWPEGV